MSPQTVPRPRRSLLVLIALSGFGGCAGSPASRSASRPAPASAPTASVPGTVVAGATTADPKRGTLAGVVLDLAGRPLDGALVSAALVSLEERDPESPTVRSAGGGRFEFAALDPGAYLVSATAPGLFARPTTPQTLAAGAAVRGLTLRAAAANATIRGRVKAARGVSPIRVFAEPADSANGADAVERYATEAQADGSYRLDLPRADYLVWAAAPGHRAPLVRADAAAERELDLGLRRVFPIGSPAPAEVRAWLQKAAIPLTTVEAGHGFADLEPLRPIIGAARLVGLGEATHGTREFFQLKHRMLEFLVERMGFTGFAIEASYADSLAIDEYVLGGKGDPAAAIAGMRFWTWNTEEVLELVRWMRRYNEDPRHRRKLHFYGFDMQSTVVGSHRLAAYLRQVDPNFAATFARALEPLDDDFSTGRYRYLPAPVQQKTREAIAGLIARLDAERARYERRAGTEAWALARLGAVVLRQAEELLRSAQGGYGLRDRSMAENIAALLELGGPDAKLVLWAHNGHVSTDPGDLGPPMGTHLEARFGPAYVPVGLFFRQGSFQAIDLPSTGESRGLIDFTVPPAPEGSIEDTLARLGLPLCAVPLASAPTSGVVADWLDGEPSGRIIGAAFHEDLALRLSPLSPRHQFEALLFIEKTSSARPNPGSRSSRQPTSPAPIEPQLANLDFGAGRPGELPERWQRVFGPQRLPYETALAERCPRAGERCVRVGRPGLPWSWGFGGIEQRVDATPWRGRRVRLRAMVRAETAGPGSGAQLYLDFLADNGPGRPAGRRLLGFTGMPERPIVSPEWRSYEVEAEVPEGTGSISLGFVFTGQGSAAISQIAFEPLPAAPAPQSDAR